MTDLEALREENRKLRRALRIAGTVGLLIGIFQAVVLAFRFL